MAAPKSKKEKESPLVASAVALENELATWEETLVEASRLEVTSDKQLHRAKNLLEACGASERVLAEQLHAFVTAMQSLQDRQRGCMERTLEEAKKIQDRVATRSALLERFADLGRRAGEINEPVAAVMEAIGRKAPPDDLVGPLAIVATKTEEVVDAADAVAKDARQAEWLDIAREADALKQQIQSVKNKVISAHRNVASRASS
jgi:chromosome segregation ATPase